MADTVEAIKLTKLLGGFGGNHYASGTVLSVGVNSDVSSDAAKELIHRKVAVAVSDKELKGK